MRITPITPIQERAIQLLHAGSTVAATARELGIDRTTIYAWRKNHPFFPIALAHARKIQAESVTDGLLDLASTALDTLREILIAKDIPAAVRLRAAQTVLSQSATTTAPRATTDTDQPTGINHAGIEALIGPPIQHNSTDFDTFSASNLGAIRETIRQRASTWQSDQSCDPPQRHTSQQQRETAALDNSALFDTISPSNLASIRETVRKRLLSNAKRSTFRCPTNAHIPPGPGGAVSTQFDTSRHSSCR